MKKLVRPHENRKVAGVCAGFADYFGIDPTFIRAVAVIAGILSWGIPVVIAYVACWIIIPEGSISATTPSQMDDVEK